MIAPLRLSFDVACSVEHAFTVWTSKIGTWWPPDHTVTGHPDLVVLQGGVGGRIYERTSDGVEHDWGKVTVWRPPSRLAYSWHLGRDAADATEVEIRFRAQGAAATRIEIEHRGWERLGTAGRPWRDQNQAGWQGLLPHYLAAIADGGAPGTQTQQTTTKKDGNGHDSRQGDQVHDQAGTRRRERAPDP